MANNLSFAVAINLLTENFKKGTQEIKNGFNEIKSTALNMAGVLGLGLGLEHTIKEMINVARESAAVNKALKVASGGWEEYGKNQKYIIEISEKFGLSINEMTGAFAKFTASAKTSNISLKDQQTLFSGLNAAMLASGVSGDKKAEVFDSMSKMMQKGTIQLKPLIAGLGLALPESLSIMAKAMGVSVDKLRDMAKHGKLLANDVFPKFGAELEKTFNNVDTDTIGGALNRIGNSFEELTAKLNVGSIYKDIIKTFGEGFKWIVDNFKLVGDAIVNVISTTIIAKAFGALKAGYIEIQAAAQASYIQQAIAAEKLAVAQELSNTTLSTKSQKRYLAESLAATESFTTQEFAGKKTAITLGLAFETAGTAIKSAFMSFLPMIIISGVIAIYQHFSNLAEKAKELKAIWTDYQSGLKNAGESNSQLNELRNSKKIVDDTNVSLKERQTALNTINTILGSNYQFDKNGLKINGDINTKIKERLDLLDKQSRYQYLLNKQNPNDDKIAENQSKIDVIDNQLRSDINNGKDVDKGLVNKRSDLFDERDQLYKIRDNIAKEKNKLKTELGKNTGETAITTPVANDVPVKVKENEVEKYEDTVAKSLIEYKNKLDNGSITQKQYNELLDKLNKETYDKLSGLLSPAQAKKDQVFQDAKAGVNKPLTTSFDKLSDEQDKYNKSLSALSTENLLSITNSEDYNKAQITLIDSTLKNIVSSGDITDASKEWVKVLLSKKAGLSTTEAKKDFSKYDYVSPYDNIGKSDTDIAGINLDKAKKELEELKSLALKTTEDLTTEINKKLSNVQSLDKALNLMKVRDNIKSLKKELSTGLYSGVKEVANSAKNMYEAFKAVSDTISNVDSSGWDKFLSIWDALTNTVDSILSVVNMVENLVAVTKALGVAKQAETIIESGVSAAKIATNVAETASFTGLMAAETAAAYAFIPFVGEGLALAQIGVMQGAIALAAIPKFANGGIVQGGSISGDKILARVNAGEMILNQGQQSTLFGLLNGQGGITGANTINGSVEFKLEGKALKGVLANYSKIKKKV